MKVQRVRSTAQILRTTCRPSEFLQSICPILSAYYHSPQPGPHVHNSSKACLLVAQQSLLVHRGCEFLSASRHPRLDPNEPNLMHDDLQNDLFTKPGS